jgi:hypothetical protein
MEGFLDDGDDILAYLFLETDEDDEEVEERTPLDDEIEER